MMKTTSLTLIIAFSLAVVHVQAAIDQIWLAPSNVTVLMDLGFVNMPDYDGAAKGEWTSIDTGISARINAPLVEIDSKGTIWVVSGFSDAYYMHAVWNYNPKTDQYRWVAGNPADQLNDLLVYSEFGVPSADAFPAGALCHSAHTIDKNDNIWFYGSCYEPPHNFWMFNTTSFEFTFLRNQNYSDVLDSFKALPIFKGGQGDAPDPANYPGYLQGALLFADSQNCLWLVGGYGPSGTTVSSIYKFNTTSRMWSWEGGSVNTGGVDDFEYPLMMGRWAAGGFIDANDKIWIFGGWGSYPEGEWSDLWSLTVVDTPTPTWTVEWGSNVTSFVNDGVVVSDDFHPGNMPAARSGAQLVDRRDGTLMIVGGVRYTSNTQMNDIWLFNKTSKTWKMVDGDLEGGNVPSTYSNYKQVGGKLGTRKYYGSPSGPNTNGHFILYGGVNSVSALNDIWVIPQDPCKTDLCDSNADCSSSDIWTFTCTCKEGYIGDGKTCTLSPVAPVAGPQSAPSPSSQIPNSPIAAKTPQAKTSDGSSIAAAIVIVSSLLLCLVA